MTSLQTTEAVHNKS